MLTDWKFWIVLLSVVIGTIIGMFLIPQTKQNPEILNEVKTSNVIVLFVPEKDWIQAEQILWAHYDKKQYILLEKFYDELRNGWWVKIDKINQ